MELEHFITVVKRRWITFALVSIVGLALISVGSVSMRSFKASTDLLIVSEALKDTTVSDPDLPAIIASTEVSRRVIARLNLDTEPNALSEHVKTKSPIKSSVVELTYQDSDPVRAAKIANAIADESSEYFHEIATHGYTDVLKALNKQILAGQSDVAADNKILQRASIENLYASSDHALDDLTSQLVALRSQRGQVAVALATDQATVAAYGNALSTVGPMVRGEILQKDPTYLHLQNKYSIDLTTLASERAAFHDSFPGLSALARRVQRERSELAAAKQIATRHGAGLDSSATQAMIDSGHASLVVSADQERLHATTEQLNSDEQHLKSVAEASAEVNTLRAKRDAAVARYQILEQRLGTAQADAAQGSSLGRLVVVSRAIPGRATVPLTWLLALVTATLAIAVACAFAVDAIDQRLWGSRDIERIYGREIFHGVGGRS